MIARSFERRPQKGDSRALSIGSRDVEHRWQPVLWPTETIEQRGYSLQAQPIASGRDHRQPVELRLDAWVRRARKVSHYAAFFSGFGAK
jgi:hypothetical protein